MRTRNSNVLLIYNEMIPSILLAGHSQMDFLKEIGRIEYRHIEESKVTNTDLNWADVVVFGRLDDWYAFELAKRIKKANRKLIYAMDDDLLNVSTTLSSAPYYRNKEIRRYIEEMIQQSDAVLSPSRTLIDKYAVDGRKGIRIEEPALLCAQKVRRKSDDEKIKIGFAGSIDRTKDIEAILSDVLSKIKMEYGSKVEFSFFGAIPSFAKTLDAKIIPYCTSYEKYLRTLNESEWDIGLAPMPASEFHSCKHYIKYIEYAASGVVGVFSDVMPYLQIKNMAPEVLLCENTEDAWYRAIKELIDDTEKREELRQMAYLRANQSFLIEAVSQNFEKEARAFFMYQVPSDAPEIDISFIRPQLCVRKVFTRIHVLGWKAPWFVAKKIMKVSMNTIKKIKETVKN